LSKAEQLVSKGKKLLEKGDFNKAAQAFSAALKKEDAVPIRNNLALSLFMSGKPKEALEVLSPLLSAGEAVSEANPFTYALASRICCSLGREEEARRWLKLAEKSFDDGVGQMLRSFREVPAAFCDYITIIMQAAGDLKDHRRVFELYRRWEPYHRSWENRLLAGAACFNLGRYNRAAGLWSSIAEAHPLLAGMQQVAFLVERGVIPPFEIGYDIYGAEAMEKMLLEPGRDEEALERCFRDGYIRMTILSLILHDGEDHEAGKVAYSLVTYNGEWGKKLGRSILDSPVFGKAVKMGAARALVELGVLPENEPFPMFIDGQRRMVELKKTPVVPEPDEKLDALVEKALKLRDKGELDEAIKLLRDLYEEGPYYPRAVLALANLLRQKGELDDALELMEELEDLAPDNPAVLFNFAALMVQMGRTEEARWRLANIDKEDATEDLLKKIELLERQIEWQELLSDLPERFVGMFEEEERKRIEEKALPPDPTLSRGLKNMPANWLSAACLSYGLEPARLRRDREKQLIDFLSRRGNLEKIVEELQPEEQELLEYLLRKGGWSRLNAVTRKFGSMEGDGFYWEEEDPESSLGFLWSRALVMVGRAVIDGRRTKIVTIPLELREPLKEIFGLT